MKTPIHLQILGSLILLVAISSCSLHMVQPSQPGKKVVYDRKRLTEVPNEIIEDSSITSLSLFGNNLSSLPPQFGNLKNLEVLYLGENNFKTFPEEICDCEKLRVLSLAYNELDALPPCLGKLKSLEWLILNNNHIKELPEEIGTLTQLDQLVLQRNELKHLPDTLLSCSRLRILNVNYNLLEDFPQDVSRWSSLRELRMYNAGQMLRLPNTICDLRFLEILQIDPSIILPLCLSARKTTRLRIVQSSVI